MKNAQSDATAKPNGTTEISQPRAEEMKKFIIHSYLIELSLSFMVWKEALRPRERNKFNKM